MTSLDQRLQKLEQDKAARREIEAVPRPTLLFRALSMAASANPYGPRTPENARACMVAVLINRAKQRRDLAAQAAPQCLFIPAIATPVTGSPDTMPTLPRSPEFIKAREAKRALQEELQRRMALRDEQQFAALNATQERN